jgi:protein-tyrosine phosphatase
MAEKYLAHRSPHIDVASAGIAALEGAEIPHLTEEVLNREGISASLHLIKQVSKDMMEWADIVFTMEHYQKERLIELYPEEREKVHLLGEYAGYGYEIPDPYGSSIEAYETCFSKIKECVDKIADMC